MGSWMVREEGWGGQGVFQVQFSEVVDMPVVVQRQVPQLQCGVKVVARARGGIKILKMRRCTSR